MVAVARARLASVMTNFWPWWHSSDSMASRGDTFSGWQKCTGWQEGSLWFIFVCLLKPTQDVYFPVLHKLKKAASIAMATQKGSRLPFSLWDFQTLWGVAGVAYIKTLGGWLAGCVCACVFCMRLALKHLSSRQINPVIRPQSACVTYRMNYYSQISKVEKQPASSHTAPFKASLCQHICD